MSTLSKRGLLGWTAAAAIAALVGCGKKEEAAPAAAAPAAAPSAAAAAAPPKGEPLKAAWVYIGPVGDAGWTYAHDQGRKAVEAEFGDKVKTTFATWRPVRVLLGAYLFGGVTMAQFALQGAGVDFSSQLLAMLPYVATIVVLAIISRNPTWIRINMPASLGKPFHPGS